MKRGLQFAGVLLTLLVIIAGCGGGEEEGEVEDALASFAESEHHRPVEETSCARQDPGWDCTAGFADGEVINCAVAEPSDDPEFRCTGTGGALDDCKRRAGFCFEAGNEPRIGPNTDLCPDLRSGGEYIAFRVLAKGVSCKEAADVAGGAGEDEPPEGWTCDRVQGDFTACTKGRATVGFNRP